MKIMTQKSNKETEVPHGLSVNIKSEKKQLIKRVDCPSAMQMVLMK